MYSCAAHIYILRSIEACPISNYVITQVFKSAEATAIIYRERCLFNVVGTLRVFTDRDCFKVRWACVV